MRTHASKALAAIVPLVALLAPSREASASSFSVNPVQVYLSPKTPSTLVTIRNDSDETLRFQLTAFAWDQTSDEPLQLTPTEDVIFFPPLLTLAPREERKVRIGAATPFGATEKTYRLFVQELPTLARPGDPAGVKVLTRMGIPVFLEASRVVARASLDEIGVRNRKLSFRIANSGNTHFVVEKIFVRGLGQDGALVLNRTLDGWYILPGRARAYEVDIPETDCTKIAAVAFEVRIGKTVLEERVEAPPTACTP